MNYNNNQKSINNNNKMNNNQFKWKLKNSKDLLKNQKLKRQRHNLYMKGKIYFTFRDRILWEQKFIFLNN